MNESQNPLPDWVSSNVETAKYLELMSELRQGTVNRLFRVNNLLFYVFIGAIMSEYLWDRSMFGAVIILLAVIGLSISTITIFTKLSNSLTLGRLKDLFFMIPTLSKLFVFGSFMFMIVMSAGTFVTFNSPEPVSFVDIMYTSFPIAIAIFNITMTYPLTLLRRHEMKKQYEESKTNQSQTDVRTIHKQGNVEMAEIEDTEPNQMSSEELLNKMTDGNPSKVIMDQIANSKKYPMSLGPEEIDTLSENDCLEEYIQIHSSTEQQMRTQ